MAEATIREQLHRQIETLPDDVVEQLADFALFVMARRRLLPEYQDWDSEQWETLALAQFFRAEESADEVGYSLEDAAEVFRP